ncbi:MAG: TonB-dependent receptor [Azospirillum sp.]|nr:TonB-dependent receptor [Azospirillum sp.]
MNPALLYAAPAALSKVEVMAGITPVSRGGDSIGGTILLEPAAPIFAKPGEGFHVGGSLSSFYRSNDHAIGGATAATAATGSYSLGYDGSWTRARNYHRGGDGAPVLSSLYEVEDHKLTAAARSGGNLFSLEGGLHHSPYQGFPNARMDMTQNLGFSLKPRWQGDFDWGSVDALAFWQHVAHGMNFLNDKGGSANGGMPMNTDASDLGYSVKVALPLSARDTVRVGNEFHRFELDDWWPAVPGSMMMSPDTFNSINNGQRNHLGIFAEWEARWTPEWTTLLGVRNDVVWMDTGRVQPYSTAATLGMGMMAMANPDAADARAFNAADRARTDVNFDVTALARFEPIATTTVEAGYARKSRSPNLYERYSWSTGAMASAMIGWFGDANSYVGNLDLKPEVAHTGAVTFGLHDARREDWEIKATPYVTYVEDFIDVDRVADLGNTFVRLKFANHDALLYGFDLSGRVGLFESAEVGRFELSGVAGVVHGERLDRSDNLYHMMPLHLELSLEHRLGGWSSAIELALVDAKHEVQSLRNEPSTPGYGLVNLRAGYQWEHVRFDVGVDNLFNKLYYQPLGGVDFGGYRARYGTAAPANVGPGPLPGPGRSVNLGLKIQF